MPEMQTLLLFSLASLALTATPGPDMLLIAARSGAQGRLAGFATYFGVATGSMCHALALAFGLSQLFLAVPYAYDIVRYLGAAYLLFLAWQAFRVHDAALQTRSDRKMLSFAVMFRQGLLSNLLNPKVALFFLALFPQFVDPAAGGVAAQILILALVLNGVGLIVNGTVVLVASGAGAVFARGRGFARWSRYVVGGVFAALALRLVFDGEQR
jgi:threonine/homoserine/homoserine lactone efflux protein